jgi:hypothetical protein
MGMPRETLRELLVDQKSLMADMLGRLEVDAMMDFRGLDERD